MFDKDNEHGAMSSPTIQDQTNKRHGASCCGGNFETPSDAGLDGQEHHKHLIGKVPTDLEIRSFSYPHLEYSYKVAAVPYNQG